MRSGGERYLVQEGASRRGGGPGHLSGEDSLWGGHGTASTVPHPIPRPSSHPRGGLGAVLERWDPGITGARALAVVGVIAALVSGVFLWASRPEPQPVPLDSPPPEPAPPSTLHARPVAAPTTTPPETPLVVHITGDVRKPGIVTLPPGSRVADALDAAGGLRKNGKVGTVNLARRLTDGEQIIVGSDLPEPPVLPPSAPGTSPAPGTPLDLNTATLDQLQQLPGVGPVLAQRILDHRSEHGPFRTVDQLQDVTGIGERRFAELKDKIHVTGP